MCFLGGRRNRSKQQQQQQGQQTKTSETLSATSSSIPSSSSKDNHHSNGFNKHTNHNNNNISTTTSSVAASADNHHPVVVCESCILLDAEIKRCRNELGQAKQLENEVRQKTESCATAKATALAKTRECEALEKKYLNSTQKSESQIIIINFYWVRVQELQAGRQTDRHTIQSTERRLTDERRQRQSSDAQLSAERKLRKQVEEKAIR